MKYVEKLSHNNDLIKLYKNNDFNESKRLLEKDLESLNYQIKKAVQIELFFKMDSF